MTSSKGGQPTKDQVIRDKFNLEKRGGLTKREIIAARKEARLEKLRQDKLAVKDMVSEVNAEVTQEVAGEIKILEEDARESELSAETEEEDKDDAKSAIKMLRDLRYAYRNAKGSTGKKGKRRLVEMMEDDKDFKFVVKELLKIEASLLAARIRKEGGDGEGSVGQQNFFVVLKGLEAEKSLMPVLEGGKDQVVDLGQVQRAISADQSSPDTEEQENERERPADIFKTVEGVA